MSNYTLSRLLDTLFEHGRVTFVTNMAPATTDPVEGATPSSQEQGAIGFAQYVYKLQQGQYANLTRRFCNSTTLSDVTIRFGVNGERVFYGHKLLLAGRSSYFKAAFTGNFAVSKSS